ncbi:MBL fold metallo-hydrolase [Phenylobacterium sp.]|uniref:MBL fold metallo-hydrolase n=1 Tax=Phenylobacterium sp. TaxID=1871053 RepID=UPI002C8A2291|nr:MBL fold metallo-hydrolase [Phenylobacterium sp.]HLZ73485.1 MBL fold metallo-hydrolase [Phenylobacterium sp.]
MRSAIAALIWLAAPAVVFAQPGDAPKPQAMAPGVWMIPGSFRPNRQPDGNTVVFETLAGLVVMDTGRHAWQRQAILDFAKSRPGGIAAIVNSHWHLDHVSGNPELKRAYPHARVYASAAIDEALTGFLAKSVAEAQPYLTSGKLPPETLEDLRNDTATIENGAALKPDVAIARSRSLRIGGRTLRLNLAADAATAGDVWVYDRKSGVVATGDLVTLPAAFLDTACPEGWRAALDAIWATPFTTAIPGHGAPMTREGFASYRAAFTALIDCAHSDAAKSVCASQWVGNVGPLLGDDARERLRAQGMTEYYVDAVLRAKSGAGAECRTAVS